MPGAISHTVPLHRHDIGVQRGVIRTDAGWRPSRGGIPRRVQSQATPVHLGTDARTYLWSVFSNATTKENGISAVEHRQVGGNVLADAIAEHLHGQLCSSITLCCGFEQFPHITGAF